MVKIPKKLNFRFHNPNTSEDTADYIVKIFMEANKTKLERSLQEEATSQSCINNNEESYYVK